MTVPDNATQAASATNSAKLEVTAVKGCTSSTALREFCISGKISIEEKHTSSLV
jgi:hypothetical protein